MATQCSAQVESVVSGRVLSLAPGHRRFPVQRVVTLPLLAGPRVAGLPHDAAGFLPIDEHARVLGVEDVFAAGDGTDFPIKQDGIATQQADAAAERIAAHAGVSLTPQPFRPLLQGWLLTGESPSFFAAPIAGGGAGTSSHRPLWSPPTKVAGHYLGPWLTAHGVRPAGRARAGAGVIPVEAAVPVARDLARSGLRVASPV